MSAGVTDEQIDDISRSVSNWGRWGADDQIGTVNFITDEVRRAAAATVSTGQVASLSRVLDLGPGHHGVRAPVHTTWKTHLTPAETAADFIGLAFHGPSVTHLDALNHVHRDDTTYNGHDARVFDPIGGYPVLGVEHLASKLCGRGVLLDLARAGIAPAERDGRSEYGIEHLEACAEALGVEVRSGDMLLVRFGDVPFRHDRPTPGLAAEVALWLRDREVAALGSDGPSDAFPAREGRWKVPIHQLAIWAMGMPLFDNCDLGAVSELAHEHGRYEFLLVASALPIPGATGSPFNPIAMF